MVKALTVEKHPRSKWRLGWVKLLVSCSYTLFAFLVCQNMGLRGQE
jgi:hypothetical protein